MRFATILAAAFALSACGGHTARTPEDVARAWSAALDRSDDDAAASLFAPAAEVVQDGAIVLHTHDDASAWNAALPCGGTITRVVPRGPHEVLVVLRLRERPGHVCDAPGAAAAAVFRVRNGKIVLWHQTQPPGEAPARPGGQPV